MHVYTEQFKTVSLTLRFFMPLSLKTASTAKVLLQMMSAKTTLYPTRKALNEALEEAYDASLNTAVSLFYDHVELKIQLRFVDPKMLNDEAYMPRLLKVFKSVLHEPLWDPNLIDQEKQFILDDIKTKESQKSYLASSLLTDTLLEHHPYHLPSTEEAPSIEAVTLTDVQALFETLIKSPSVILAAGPVLEEELTTWLLTLDLPAHPPFKPAPIIKNPISQKAPFVHPSKMHQVYRYLVYDTGIYRDDPDYFAFQVFQHILGGDSDSLLFKRIRETHSMAYSVNAVASIKYGLLIIQGSIDPDKTALFDTEVAQILEDIVLEGIPLETLNLAKQSLKERFKRNSDSMGVLSNRALMHYYYGEPFEIDENLKNIDAVTLNDVKKMASRLKMIYAFRYGGLDESL